MIRTHAERGADDERRTQVDAIVVGGGLAGLAATQRLAANGLSVALVEKRERLGGSSAMSGGWFALSGTALQRRAGVEDSDETLRRRHGRDRRRLRRRAAAARASSSVRRTRSPRSIAPAAWTDELKVSAGMTVARAHLIRIRDLLAFLEREAVAAGAEILPSHAADELVMGRAPGGRHPIGERDLAARAGVVLTSGGFSRSRELLELFVPDQAAAMPYGGVGNTGDGLRMAWMLGAGLADIGHVSGTYGQHADTTDDEHELLTANYLGAILVNARGERFTDESESYKVLGSAVLGQPGAWPFRSSTRWCGRVEARRAALRHGADRGARPSGERADDRGARARSSGSRADGSSAPSSSTTRACRVGAADASAGPVS